MVDSNLIYSAILDPLIKLLYYFFLNTYSDGILIILTFTCVCKLKRWYLYVCA